MKKITCVAVSMLCAVFFVSTARSAMEGAFGVNFGDSFAPDSAIKEFRKTKDGPKLYQFTPSNPFGAFKVYYVMITPMTHKVYGIGAFGKIEDPLTKSREADMIGEQLKRKYRNQSSQYQTKSSSVARGFGFLQQQLDSGAHTLESVGNRYVELQAPKETAYLEIKYIDKDLERVSEREAEGADSVESVSSIVGAFGMTLGDTFENKTGASRVQSSHGDVVYRVQVPIPHVMFVEYFVKITPQTHRIYEIVGIGDPGVDQTRKLEAEKLAEVLKKKYPREQPLTGTDRAKARFKGMRMTDQGDYPYFRTSIGDRDVKLYMIDDALDMPTSAEMQSAGGIRLEIKYVDIALTKEVRKEEQDMIGDTSGL